MKRIPRHSEINITDVDGIVHTGTGDGLTPAVGDLASKAETCWTLTDAGAAIVCTDRLQQYLADDTVQAAVAMTSAYELADRLAEGWQ